MNQWPRLGQGCSVVATFRAGALLSIRKEKPRLTTTMETEPACVTPRFDRVMVSDVCHYWCGGHTSPH